MSNVKSAIKLHARLNLMDIDFSPILSSPTYEKDKEKLTTSGKKRALQIWLVILGIFIPIFWPVLIFLLVRYIINTKSIAAARAKSLTDFAKRNNFTFKDVTAKFAPIPNENIRKVDLPFKNLDHIIDAHALSGEVLGHPFTYTMSSIFLRLNGDSSQFPYNIFTITLPISLPRVYINSKSNNLKGLDPSALNFDAVEDHELEGDFPLYYDVHIEKNEQIDMYTILTPEVMDTLKRNHYFDVWLSGKELTLITFADQARYFAAVPLVFESAISLMHEIDRLSRSIR